MNSNNSNNNNNKIKMIGLDLDGTTLNGESKFSERTVQAFRSAFERGIEIVIATGRAENSLPEEMYHMDGIRYVATSNGARVLDISESDPGEKSKVVYENFISPARIDEIYRLLRDNDADIEVFFDGRAYIGKREYDSIVSGENTTRNKDYIVKSRTPSDRIYELLIENRDRIENINVNYRDMPQKPAMEKRLYELSDVNITSSVPHNNEIGGKTTSKADALRFLMELKGLSPENLMACGDNPNDLAMIKLAGIGVAVGNAEEIVKAQADYITLPNYEDGVAIAIEKFAL